MLSLIFSIISLACSRHCGHTSPCLHVHVRIGMSLASTSNTISAPSHPSRLVVSSYSATDEYAAYGALALIVLSKYLICVNWLYLSLGPRPILSNANFSSVNVFCYVLWYLFYIVFFVVELSDFFFSGWS